MGEWAYGSHLERLFDRRREYGHGNEREGDNGFGEVHLGGFLELECQSVVVWKFGLRQERN